MSQSNSAVPQRIAPQGLRDLHIRNLFIIPTLALLIVFNVFPLFWSLILSFTEYKATDHTTAPAAIGLGNYRALLAHEPTQAVFVFTAKFTVLAVAIECLLGFGMAMLLNRKFPGKGLVVTLLLLPMMMSTVVMAKFFKYIIEPNQGVLSYLLDAGFGASVHWFSHPTTALWSLVMLDVWQWTPFVMLISLAGLSAVPKHLYEAASIDRASAWFQFTRITLPLVAPLLMMALIFRTMDALKVFDQIILTGGGPSEATVSLSWRLKELAIDQGRTGVSCAMGYLVLVVVIGLSNLYLKYLDRIQGKAA